MAKADPITATTTVREVMTRYPHTEAIFNKYGLTGCGGRKGPMEPVGFFATVHHVDPEALLRELNEAATGPRESPSASATPTAEEPDLYPPFIKTALGVVVTVGCTLGAINLAAMALAGVTGSYWESITQAHGHAQIFGWVGLFVMGVAYHVLPRLKATELHSRPLALASFWLMLAGIVLRVVSQPFAESPSFAGIVVLSAVAELLGVSFFVYVAVRTLTGNPASSDFWDKYVVAGALWFWVAAAATVAISLYITTTGVAVIPEGIESPFLHVALMGFAAMTIFGITLRTIPVFMGLRTPDPRVFDAIFWALNLGIVLKAGSGWLSAILGPSGFPIAGYAGSALEFGSILAYVYHLGILGRRERNVREEGASVNFEKFIKAAYLWLLVAATLAAAYTLYRAATGLAVPHSLVGAYRHALTVGFISMMIVGMASRIIPVFTGNRLHSDLMLLGTFLLLNVGNTVRVVSQPLADLVGGPFFVLMGVSGFAEVAALGLFAYNLWRTIDSPAEEDAAPLPTEAHGPITRGMIVADVLNLHPQTLEIFVGHGFTPLRNPVGRRTLARAVTVEQAAQMKGVDLEVLLRDLNRGVGPATAAPRGNGSAGEPAGMVALPAHSGSGISRELVMMALRSCYDPEIPVNIVDLGLVYGVRIDGSTVYVKLTLTAPGCPMGGQVQQEVEDSLRQVPGVGEVVVDLVFDPPWTPDRMSEEAKRKLGVPVG